MNPCRITQNNFAALDVPQYSYFFYGLSILLIDLVFLGYVQEKNVNISGDKVCYLMI